MNAVHECMQYLSACMVMNSCMNVPSNMQVTWQCERTWRWASWPSEIASYALYLNPCMCMQTHHFIHACHMTTHKHTAERKENTEPRNCKSLCTSASTGWKTDKQPVPQHLVLVLPQAFGQPIQWRFCFCSSGLSFIWMYMHDNTKPSSHALCACKNLRVSFFEETSMRLHLAPRAFKDSSLAQAAAKTAACSKKAISYIVIFFSFFFQPNAANKPYVVCA